MKALIMGLGLHGGGLESALFLARRGAELTITDLRDEKTLAPSIEKLEEAGRAEWKGRIRYVLGRHEKADFEKADLVIKNPGVKPDSPYLKAAKRIETDISLFLRESSAPLIAVTGSKGKSSVASALHWALNRGRKAGKTWLGGNITVSPLSFLDALQAEDDVVLELSSWQLGDLRGNPLLKPRIALITAILPDHQNWYDSMESYAADKRVIGHAQDERDALIAFNDQWGERFFAESRGRCLAYWDRPLPGSLVGAWFTDSNSPGLARLSADAEALEVLPARLHVPGAHQRLNLLSCALALLDLGMEAKRIQEALGSYGGIEHRLEFFHETEGIRFVNDTAATIPEAAAAAIEALAGEGPLILIAGGADKSLDFSPLVPAAAKTKTVILLEGSATAKLKSLLDGAGIACRGPFDSLDAVLKTALEYAAAGDIIALSPGCASFGMFSNEFDRGRQWKECVRNCGR
ncbi:MAG: UDP-N-acetylmuramoyl-L-alanine--D-glutamate ligase [Treponema sp.]|jgi:UDP-N-acetylmuramoylalanine--D-glutamate ligase|nr:UDP-N-acetylmuramoyl-L-alanine--D-glutamate ligase [Treponema sp.]